VSGLADEPGAYLAGRQHGPEELVLPRGPGLSTPLPEGLRLYGLRQTAASVRIREGTSVKAVQRQLGHAAASTLDTYGHLFPDELEELAGRVDRAAPRR
jgi:integrase